MFFILILENSILKESELRSWILSNAYPDVIEFSERNMDLMFSDKRPGFQNHVLLFVDKTSTQSDPVLQAFRQQSRLFTSKCIFITVDISAVNMNEFTQNLLSDLNIDVNEAPKVLIIKSARTKIEFYNMEIEDSHSITGDAVQLFVNNFFSEKIEPIKVIHVPK